jgi:hypothetical protein
MEGSDDTVYLKLHFRSWCQQMHNLYKQDIFSYCESKKRHIWLHAKKKSDTRFR